MAKGDAIRGIERLMNSVGDGDIVARCTVDQPYAQRQHEELTWKHPRGGRAKYLEAPLFENHAELMQGIADSLITEDGSDLERGMINAAEQMSRWVEDNAPKEDQVLMFSGHPQVIDGGMEVYDRPPKKSPETS